MIHCTVPLETASGLYLLREYYEAVIYWVSMKIQASQEEDTSLINSNIVSFNF